MFRIHRHTILVAGLVALLGAPPALRAQAAPARPKLSASLEAVRTALDRYADPFAAMHDGYFSTVACVDYPTAGGAGTLGYPAGGMGVHFLNPGRIGAPIDSLKPQVLLYEPDGDKLRLVAAEWFVPVAVSKQRPQIFGKGFDGPMEGHHPIMPPELHHWDLHVWLWKENPAGVFSATNPALVCPAGAYTMHEVTPKQLPTP